MLKDFVREILREQLKTYMPSAQTTFEKASSGGVGGGMSEEELVDQLTTLFLQADQDGNGVLDKHEFKKLMHDANLGLTKKQIKLLYSQADMNDDGSIEYRESFQHASSSFYRSRHARRRAQREMAEAEAEAEATTSSTACQEETGT